MLAATGSISSHSLLLVDDEAEYLRLARALLNGHANLAVLGEAASVEEAIELLQTLRPEAVILDVYLPGTTGFHAARRLLDLAPRLRIILVSALDDAQYAPLARAVGAAAFLPKKNLSAESVLHILRQPNAGLDGVAAATD